MEYGLPVWYRPVSANTDTRRKGTVWIAKALGRVQRLACKVITGALRTTATDTLDFHANLLPTHIRLNRSVFNATARIASLPPSHPLHRAFLRCQRVPLYHRSQLHHCIAAFPLLRTGFETIDPHLVIENTLPGLLATRIARTKDDARREMERITRRGGFCIYTDGSGFEGGVGAAAVAWGESGELACRQKHLGSEDEHTVFESEVVGAIFALDIVKATPRLTSVDIIWEKPSPSVEWDRGQ